MGMSMRTGNRVGCDRGKVGSSVHQRVKIVVFPLSERQHALRAALPRRNVSAIGSHHPVD